MNEYRKTDPLEVAVHTIIILFGILILRIAYDFKDQFWQSLLINIGSSLVVVTLLFSILETFRRRHDDKEKKFSSVNEKDDTTNREEKTQKIIYSLRASQNLPITENSSKLNDTSSGRV